MKNSTQSALRYRPPTASDFQRILRLWKKISPERKRKLVGSQAQKLGLCFGSSIFNTLGRLDALAIPGGKISRRELQLFNVEKQKLRREIKLCGEIGHYLARCKLAADHR